MSLTLTKRFTYQSKNIMTKYGTKYDKNITKNKLSSKEVNNCFQYQSKLLKTKLKQIRLFTCIIKK